MYGNLLSTALAAALACQISVEDEVLANIRAQPLGPATVGDLALPEPFLRRYADRIIRSSFEDQFRIVVTDKDAPPVVPDRSAAPPVHAPAAPEPEGLSASTILRVAGVIVALAAVLWLALRRRRSA